MLNRCLQITLPLTTHYILPYQQYLLDTNPDTRKRYNKMQNLHEFSAITYCRIKLYLCIVNNV